MCTYIHIYTYIYPCSENSRATYPVNHRRLTSDVGLMESIPRQPLKCFQRNGKGAVDRFRGPHIKSRGCFRTLGETVIPCVEHNVCGQRPPILALAFTAGQ